MDINLGPVQITKKQASNLSSLRSDVVKGFCLWEDEKLIATTTRELSEQERSDLLASVNGLPNNYSQEHLLGAFDVVMFQGDLMNLLPVISTPNLRLEFGAINTFASNKDFSGMQQYLGFLLQNQIATQGDVDAVLGCVSKQGIIL